MVDVYKIIFGLIIIVMLSGCQSSPDVEMGKSYLFGSFRIDDRTEHKESATFPLYFAFRNSESKEYFLYDPQRLFLLRCASSPEESFQVLEVPPGEYYIYSVIQLNEDQTAFLTYYDGVIAETELQSIQKVSIKAGQALYLGDYSVEYSEEEGLIVIYWTIKNKVEHDSALLHKKGSVFSKTQIKSIFTD